MKQVVLLGAPSFGKDDAKTVIIAAFAKAAFPLDVAFENHAAQAIVLPEVGLHLMPVSHEGNKQTAVVRDFDLLQRVGATIEQLAFLSKAEAFISIEAEDGEAEDLGGEDPNLSDDDPGADEGGDGDSSNPGSGEGDSNHSDSQKTEKPAGNAGRSSKNKG
jgi:hypothetical protein